MHLSSVCEYRDAEGNKLFKALEESKSTYEDMKINTDALNIMKSGDYVAPADKHVSFSPEPEVKGKYFASNMCLSYLNLNKVNISPSIYR